MPRRITSLNVALAQPVEIKGRKVMTAIGKRPVEGPLAVRALGLDGRRAGRPVGARRPGQGGVRLPGRALPVLADGAGAGARRAVGRGAAARRAGREPHDHRPAREGRLGRRRAAFRRLRTGRQRAALPLLQVQRRDGLRPGLQADVGQRLVRLLPPGARGRHAARRPELSSWCPARARSASRNCSAPAWPPSDAEAPGRAAGQSAMRPGRRPRHRLRAECTPQAPHTAARHKGAQHGHREFLQGSRREAVRPQGSRGRGRGSRRRRRARPNCRSVRHRPTGPPPAPSRATSARRSSRPTG